MKRTRGSCFSISYSPKEIGVSLCPKSDSLRAAGLVAVVSLSLSFFFLICADGKCNTNTQ